MKRRSKKNRTLGRSNDFDIKAFVLIGLNLAGMIFLKMLLM